MKFNCGPTREVFLEEQNKKIKEWVEERVDWHPWFVWKPTRIESRDCRWLETVQCRLSNYDARVIRDPEKYKSYNMYHIDYRNVYDHPYWEYKK